MTCSECSCVDERAAGWIALLGQDPDDEDGTPKVFSFCPVCAAREFQMAGRLAETYI
jgi:hypothetical protein